MHFFYCVAYVCMSALSCYLEEEESEEKKVEEITPLPSSLLQ